MDQARSDRNKFHELSYYTLSHPGSEFIHQNIVDAYGKEVIIDVIGPGEIFGELSLVEEGEGRNEIAEALDDALVCAMDASAFEKVVRDSPELNLEVTKKIGLRLRKVQKRVSDMILYEFRKSGLIEFSRDSFVIKDYEKLKKMTR